MKLLEINDLSVDFKVEDRWLAAVSNVSFHLDKGEILALVGESGCGKSVTCMSLARLVPQPPGRYSSGKINFSHAAKDTSVLEISSRELRQFRRQHIAYIFQEPSVSLNPVFRVGDQIAEAIELRNESSENIKEEIISLLQQVGISEPESRMRCYPHELSGGMQQRIMIAMALASQPELLVADEPTTALDVTIQAQIMDLLRDIRNHTEMSIILVTHNLGIVADLADRVVVMYAGHTVEAGPVESIINQPMHPYTKALLAAVPDLGHAEKDLNTIPGTVPSPANYPDGCRFYGRCELAKKYSNAKKLCGNEVPIWQEHIEGHFCRCHYLK